MRWQAGAWRRDDGQGTPQEDAGDEPDEQHEAEREGCSCKHLRCHSAHHADGEIRKISGKLSNEGFLAKAPAEVIEENRARLAEEEAKQQKLAQALARLAQI
ncbi:MAG: hypothetical protein EBT71_05255 [Alphaproteobacteria bacterium]|nr:hypothetical protein [Alphaproteobacteria bacterium]